MSDLASLGLRIDHTGALRAMQEYEADVLRRTASAEAAAARHAPRYADWWEKALRRMEREQERVWNAISSMNNQAARDAERAAGDYLRAQRSADREVERSRRQAIAEQSALQRQLGEMERRTQRELAAEAAQASRQRQQMDRAAADTQETLQKEEETRKKEREKRFAQWAREREKREAAEARERARIERENQREIQGISDQLRRALTNAANQRAREEARAAREVLRAHGQALREDVQRTQQAEREKRRAEAQAEKERKQELRDRERAERETANNSSRAWESFRNYLRTLMAGLGVRQIIEYADSWKLLDARIGNVTKNEAERGAVEERLFQVTQKTRQPLEQTGLLYNRLAMATEQLGASQEDVLKVTQAVNQAFILTGSTGQEARSATLQLAHAMSENRLIARQLNSLLMDSPELMRAMVVGMGIPQQKLRQMVKEGKVTTEVMFNAILSQADRLDQKFQRMPTTVGQSLTMLQNSFIRLIGIYDKAIGGTDKISASMKWLSEHLPLVIGLISAATFGWVAYTAATRAAALYTALVGDAGVITAVLNLIKVIRGLADAAVLADLATEQLLGAVALIAAIGIGWLAYKKLQEEIAAATARSNDELLKQARGANTLTGETEKLNKEERNRRIENERMVQTALQSIELAKVQGMAQEELRINFEAANKAIEARGKFTGALQTETLGAIEEERRLRLIELQTRHSRELLNSREDILRAGQQELVIAEKLGTAQTRARIDAEAQNKIIQARRMYTGQMLDYALESIDIERRNALQKAILDVIQEYRKTVQEAMSSIFEGVLENGIKSFGQLFNTIRKMWIKMVADMLAVRFMEGIGRKFADSLSRMFGGLDKLRDSTTYSGAHGQLSPLDITAASLSAAGASLQTAATALTQAANTINQAGTHNPAYARVNPNTNEMEGTVGLGTVTATASRKQAHNFAQEFAKYAGVALAGLMNGYGIGGMTTSRVLGVGAGALSGAATGAMMGSAIPGVGTLAGGIIGGIMGGIGGLLGSNKKREERDRERNQILLQNGQRISQLKELLAGDLMRGSNLAKALEALGAYQGKNKNDFEAAAKRFGLSLTQLELIAQTVGIQIYDSAGKLIPGALKQLDEALKLTAEAATHFTNSLQDIEQRQEAYNKLFDVADTPAQKLKDAYAILEKMAPDLLKQMGLANLNLDTDAGRNVLLKGLQDIFKMIESGQLTPELLGAFTEKGQLIDAILKAKEGLDAFKESLDSVTTDFPKVRDLVIYEQMHGHGVPSNTGTTSTTTAPAGNMVTTGQIFQLSGPVYVGVVSSDPNETDEELLERVQSAIVARSQRGAATYMPGVVIKAQ